MFDLGKPWLRVSVPSWLGDSVALIVDRRGVTAVEYALIGAFIAVAIVGGVTSLGHTVTTMIASAAAAV